jgi:D-lactate dehydrogenase (cytochrome)
MVMMQFVARQGRGPRQLCRVLVSRRAHANANLNGNPARLRSLSATTRPTVVARESSKGLTIALGTALVGLGLYCAGSVLTSPANTAVSPVPVYGTAEDFKRAIKELEASFEEGVVSTDPANLSTHGFSPNVMHEGERNQPFVTN